MTTLEQSLSKYDFAHLHNIAQLWGIELRAKESKKAQKELSKKMLNQTLATEIIETLAQNAHHALSALLSNNGRISWAVFERKYGKIREIGAGKRDREKPHLTPISPAETLFYRALLARAFFDTPSGAQEFAYIPNDLFKLVHKEKETHEEKPILGRIARPKEYKHIQLANDSILDDLTALLSALRLGWDKPPTTLDTSLRFVREVGLALRLITPTGLERNAIKSHLEQSRAEAFTQLKETWLKNESFNELHQVPSIICEGEWKNDSLTTRKAIFSFLSKIPHGEWWSLNSFITDIKEFSPDFQRKGGEYDAWFIRSFKDPKDSKRGVIEKDALHHESHHKSQTATHPKEDGASKIDAMQFYQKDLRGFKHWDEVEGALLRYFITSILFWLGYVDLASAEKDGEIKAFRVRKKKVESEKTETGKIIVTSNGKITISRYAKRVARYQISRFCEWKESKNPDKFDYQITPSSLGRAKEQGLKISHLLSLLNKHANDEIPPTLEKALRRWAVNGTEARVETLVVLRLSKPEDLRALRSSRASRFLGEILSPTRVVVKAGASQKVMSALIEMGIFMEPRKT